MLDFRIRLIETIVREGSVDLTVQADTARAAAGNITKAYEAAKARGSNVISLPDGQVEILESRRIVRQDTVLVLLDEHGKYIRVIE